MYRCGIGNFSAGLKQMRFFHFIAEKTEIVVF